MLKRRFLALLLAAVLLVGLLPALNADAKADGLQYWIGVDVKNQRTTIYSTADNSVVHCWLCTTGASATPTPQGTFYLPEAKGSERKEWFSFTRSWVKYAVRYTRRLYFHSILFRKADDNSMMTGTLHHLGKKGSAGCVRLEVQHAKWLCDNCPTGTMVVIYSGVDDPRITSILGHQPSLETTPSLPAPPIVTGLTLSAAGPITMNKGETLQLYAAVEPAYATTSIRWKSSKTKYVKVDQNGLVTAVGNGPATITATTSNGIQAKVQIDSVDPTIARSVSLVAPALTVNVGETLQLGAVTDPATAAAALTWKSSKARYATVDGSGLVTGMAAGTAKITVTTSNRKKATVTVKVLDPYAPASVALAEVGPLTLHVGESLTLNPVLTPATAKTTFTWTSSKKARVAVDGSGTITALRKGKVKITVKTANKKRASIVVNVVD